MSKIIDVMKRVWQRLGEVDVNDDIDIANLASPEGTALGESMSRINGIETAFNKATSSSTSPKGGKGNSVVERAEVDTEKAMQKAEQKSTQRESGEKQR